MGDVLGYTVLNEYIVVFTTSESNDYIYRLRELDNYFECVILSGIKLGFDKNYPIQCFGVYENNNIQKVYWTDGLNQPRVINITKAELTGNTISQVMAKYTATSFDFV